MFGLGSVAYWTDTT